MRYIRFAITILVTIISLSVYGQPQQGYVKTKGRMVNGKHVPGQGLVGATVDIQGGNSYNVQNKDGSFSFPIPSQTFVVKSVLKKDYQLIDVDALKKSYHYSKNPLYLVMEKPEQQKQDLLESERKIRRTLQRQLQKREDELDALKEEHKITIEEYQEALQQLYASQEKNERFISNIAREYAQLDFDQMTDLNRRIHDAISNGRLVEADSLINSKGDIYRRIAKLNQHHDANVRVRSDLEKSEMLEQSNRMEIAEDCYCKYKVFIQANRVDSALCYLKMRADLDSTNIQWAWDYAQLCDGQKNYIGSREYYERALLLTENIVDKDSKEYIGNIIGIKNSLAAVYHGEHEDEKSEMLYLELLTYLKELSSKTTENYDDNIAMVKGNLSILYMDTQRYEEGEALELEVMRHELQKKDSLGISGGWFLSLWNRAISLSKRNKFVESEELLTAIINLHKENTKDSVLMCKFFYVDALIEVANIYYKTQRVEESERLYFETLSFCYDCMKKYDGVVNHIPQIFNNLANIYFTAHRYSEAEKTFQLALEGYQHLAEGNPLFNPYVIGVFNNLALLYKDMQRLEECEKVYTDALVFCRRLVHKNPQSYNIHLCGLLKGMGNLYFKCKRYDDCVKVNKEALDVYHNLYEKDSLMWYKEYAEMLGNISYYTLFKKGFTEAEIYAREGLIIDSLTQFINTNLAAALLFQGKYTEAKKIYCQYKFELKDSFLDDFKVFAEAGVIPKKREKDVEKIKQLLNK